MSPDITPATEARKTICCSVSTGKIQTIQTRESQQLCSFKASPAPTPPPAGCSIACAAASQRGCFTSTQEQLSPANSQNGICWAKGLLFTISPQCLCELMLINWLGRCIWVRLGIDIILMMCAIWSHLFLNLLFRGYDMIFAWTFGVRL